jgi:hypothetical protein
MERMAASATSRIRQNRNTAEPANVLDSDEPISKNRECENKEVWLVKQSNLYNQAIKS